ncbi:M48 family metallopeptidase [Edaphobacter albus]|uniref:M48 family metallopeptidase n=1 Tax=Edaphobacter sp. 4G125 TaxID=2763071 RepID=UPI001644041F|nr:M48 family metallopeptidase [Edaphobacter sp. 4G125]QNI37420.1 M48 family metallopeptidase [Edaphobacter sp. 4G125]
MRLRILVFLLLLSVSLLVPSPLAAQTSAEPTTQVQTDSNSQQHSAYSLSPEKLERAIAYSRIRVILDFAGSGWGILQLILLLGLGVVAKMRNVAIHLSRNRWAQGFAFIFLLLAVTTALDLPLDLYGHHAAVVYGQSVQGWGSWAWDAVKSFLLTLVFGGLLVMLLFWVIRKSPSRWWFWFWIPAMVAVLIGVFVAPVLIDPLFNKFEPLEKTNPALVERLEKVVARGGIHIPPDRMYLMKASEKVTTLNAYVTGYGASKRVVVWDNSVNKATPDEISFIFGHEMGHYVLNHIPATLIFLGILLLVEFYIGFRGVRWLIARYGSRWKIASQNDWGALVVLLLVLAVLSFFSEPIVNGYSRMHEHEADVYGQEAIHGIVSDPQKVAQQSFQLLGELSLTDPNPNPFVEFWSFSHPSVASRAAFAEKYNPWVAGGHPKYFAK